MEKEKFSEHVTLDNYCSLAEVTTNVLKDKMELNPDKDLAMRQVCLAMTGLGHPMDQFKRMIFYKKGVDPVWINNLVVGVAVDAIANSRAKGNARTITAEQYRLLHAAVGVASEAAELMQAVIDHVCGGPIDKANLLEEGGDLCWYIAEMLNATGQTFSTMLQANIEKLAARYPDGFTQWSALNRDLDVERKILEQHASE